MRTATTRSHLGDGRCVGWFGSALDDGLLAIDAELVDQPVPQLLLARYGAQAFWERWTTMETTVKLLRVPVAQWLRRHGLVGRPGVVECDTVVAAGVVVTIGRLAGPAGGRCVGPR